MTAWSTSGALARAVEGAQDRLCDEAENKMGDETPSMSLPGVFAWISGGSHCRVQHLVLNQKNSKPQRKATAHHATG